MRERDIDEHGIDALRKVYPATPQLGEDDGKRYDLKEFDLHLDCDSDSDFDFSDISSDIDSDEE